MISISKRIKLCVKLLKFLFADLKLNSPPTGNVKEYGTRTHSDSPLRREGSDNFRPREEASQKGQGGGEASGDCSPTLSAPCPARTREDIDDGAADKAPTVSASSRIVTL